MAISSTGTIIDRDAYGMKVSGPELERIVRQAFAEEPDVLLEEPIRSYLYYAAALGPDRHVALVAVVL